MASLTYAAEHVGVDLIFVLGDESCGAVKTTIEVVEGRADVGEYAPLTVTTPAVDAAGLGRELERSCSRYRWSRGGHAPALNDFDANGSASTAERVAHSRADPAHDVVANVPDRPAERGLRHGVDAVAVDDRRLVEAGIVAIHVDFGREATYRRGDLGDGDEVTYIDDL